MYCNDARDIADVRASEAALRDQNTALKTQLEVSKRGDEVKMGISSCSRRCALTYTLFAL